MTLTKTQATEQAAQAECQVIRWAAVCGLIATFIASILKNLALLADRK